MYASISRLYEGSNSPHTYHSPSQLQDYDVWVLASFTLSKKRSDKFDFDLRIFKGYTYGYLGIT